MNRQPGDYAGIVSRGLAFGIDLTVTAVVSTVGAAFVRAASDVLGFRSTSGGQAAMAYMLSLPVIFVVYCTVFWTMLGKTLGMVALGVRVVTGQGSSPRVARSLLRVLAYTVSSIALVGFAWIVVDRRRQGFHDKIARTFVVYDHTAPHRTARPSPA